MWIFFSIIIVIAPKAQIDIIITNINIVADVIIVISNVMLINNIFYFSAFSVLIYNVCIKWLASSLKESVNIQMMLCFHISVLCSAFFGLYLYLF